MNSICPLFIPLKREFFEAFARGEKLQEFRPWGPRWNERTCIIGRRVVLALGYHKAHRIGGAIVALHKNESPQLLPGWRECYGNKHTAAAVITIAVDNSKPFTCPLCTARFDTVEETLLHKLSCKSTT